MLDRSFFETFPAAAGSMLEAMFRQAMRERRALSFQAEIGHAARKGPFAIRVFPHAGGVSIFCQPVARGSEA